MKKNILIIFIIIPLIIISQNTYQIAILKYNGGGDWYANPSSLPNLVKFCNKNINTNINENIATVETKDKAIYNYPFIHMTGHGNVIFNDNEIENLRNYLLSGGFLHIDDNYGMDPYIKRELKKLFPNNKIVELPYNHLIFNQTYKFSNGLPKIHQHNSEDPIAYAIIEKGKIILLYTYESDLSDGWENQEIHNNSEIKRQEALKMGANIIEYSFSK
ncbi:MAG: hypothetical protein CMP51_05390 [Flavobacteriales bacterium]|nr:hypothetical protein [Flavobacteriales bacterium]|tara:strand:- start:567 stop:1217 length:651 start_codon:yes stop_codon:yes gene_type:complete